MNKYQQWMDDHNKTELERKQKYNTDLKEQMGHDDLRKKNMNRMTRTEKRINYENL
jgi:hypothetical protein